MKHSEESSSTLRSLPVGPEGRPSWAVAQEYLETRLREEFGSNWSQLRVRRIPPSQKDRTGAGVFVRTQAREYFFPVEWVHQTLEIDREVERIKEGLAILSYSNRGIGRDGRPDPYKDF